MTARRSSATERRGVGTTPRPAALSAAVLAVLLAGSGCASRNANTVGEAAPVNQDTAAAAKDAGLPPTPAAARMLAQPRISELPSATSTAPTSTTPPSTIETTGAQTIVDQITKNPLSIGLTPLKNPAGPNKPVLEVVGMPTWLWIEGLPPVLEETTTSAGVSTTVRVWAALDQVTWKTGATSGPTFICGNGAAVPTPGQGYGIPYQIVADPAGTDAPNSCVNTFSSPYYSGPSTARTAGSYTLTGTASYHIAYTETPSGGTTPQPKSLAGFINLTADTTATPIRVGEIQALATSP
ncbi:MAG: hypothetical protein HOW97_39310 [Catenulispora sp.]|nr:hypothetical protein [Catenulispora sp.]